MFRPAKRARPDGTSAALMLDLQAQFNLEEGLKKLKKEDLTALLLDAIRDHPDVAALAQAVVQRRKGETSARRAQAAVAARAASAASVPKPIGARAPTGDTTLGFLFYVDEAHYQFNQRYERLRCSQQFDQSGEVMREVEESLDDMLAQSLAPRAPYSTRASALTAIHLILLELCLAAGEIPRAIRNGSAWERYFLEVFDTITPEECRRLKGHPRWMEHLKTTVTTTREYGLYPELGDVLMQLEAME